MSYCFLCGSKRSPQQDVHPLKVGHYVEYLTYNLEDELVQITADFIIENSADTDHSLILLHRGNISFENHTDEWIEDDYWTRVLLRFTGDEIGLFLNEESQPCLCQPSSYPVRVQLLTGDLRHWGPERPDNGGYVPFSAYMSPVVPARTVNLLRVVGELVGDSYGRLLPGPGSGEPIVINGGQSLLDQIDKDLEHFGNEAYSRRFRAFKSLYWANPAYYHVFFERQGKRSLQTLSVTSDMTKALINEEIPPDRQINWCWSDSDFNIYTLANGPIVELLDVCGASPGPGP